MARNRIPSDATVKAFRSGRRLPDGDGLYLLLMPSGTKAWRFDYRYGGKDQTLSMGVYPTVSLASARRLADQARAQATAGENPSEERKRVKRAVIASVENLRRVAAGEPAMGSFDQVANEFIDKRSTPVTDGSGQVRPPRWSVGYTDGWRGRMARHVNPWIGAMPIGDVSPIHLLEVLRKIEDRGTTDTAQKVFQMLGEVMRYAVASQLIPSDPSRDLRGALTPHTVRNLPSIVEPNKVGQVIRDIRRYRGTATVRAALQFAVLAFQRTHMLREMKWPDVDLDARLWRIPSAGMKRRRPTNSMARRTWCRCLARPSRCFVHNVRSAAHATGSFRPLTTDPASASRRGTRPWLRWATRISSPGMVSAPWHAP
jgi:hypothetical protein